MRWLAQADAFPLEHFVSVDPDKVKSLLPETPAYVAADPTRAGSLTHHESGFICEIIEREAMLAGKNVLVDGSLRNYEWYRDALLSHRRAFPAYRIGILLITASEERVYARAARRAQVTGRDIPRSVLQDSVQRAPAAYRTLAPLADYAAVIVNDTDSAVPVVQLPATLDSIRAAFADASPAVAALIRSSSVPVHGSATGREVRGGVTTGASGGPAPAPNGDGVSLLGAVGSGGGAGNVAVCHDPVSLFEHASHRAATAAQLHMSSWPSEPSTERAPGAQSLRAAASAVARSQGRPTTANAAAQPMDPAQAAAPLDSVTASATSKAPTK
jgi:hypothetical protein